MKMEEIWRGWVQGMVNMSRNGFFRRSAFLGIASTQFQAIPGWELWFWKRVKPGIDKHMSLHDCNIAVDKTE